MALFHGFCQYYGIWHNNDQIFSYLREMDAEEGIQLSFFGEAAG